MRFIVVSLTDGELNPLFLHSLPILIGERLQT